MQIWPNSVRFARNGLWIVPNSHPRTRPTLDCMGQSGRQRQARRFSRPGRRNARRGRGTRPPLGRTGLSRCQSPVTRRCSSLATRRLSLVTGQSSNEQRAARIRHPLTLKTREGRRRVHRATTFLKKCAPAQAAERGHMAVHDSSGSDRSNTSRVNGRCRRERTTVRTSASCLTS